jgi:hypothetical protein
LHVDADSTSAPVPWVMYSEWSPVANGYTLKNIYTLYVIYYKEVPGTIVPVVTIELLVIDIILVL